MDQEESFRTAGLRAPTDENLKEDCAKIAQRMCELWTGDVDFIVIATRRKESNVVWSGTVQNIGKMRSMLKKVAEWCGLAVPLNGKGKVQ